MRDHINDGTRGEFIPGWIQDPRPSDDQIDPRASTVPGWKYIYLAN